MNKIRVVHIGHSPRWRGGENQVRLLVEEMSQAEPVVEHYLAYPKNALIFERLKSKVEGVLELPGENPFDPRAIWSLIRYCKNNSIHILHAHSGNAHTLAYLVKRFVPESKVVVHRRVDNPIKRKSSTRKKYLSARIDAFIAVSKVIRDLTIDYGVAKDKVHLVYDSVDHRPYQELNKVQDKQRLIKPFGWDVATPLIGFVAAFENQKNPELFVEIVREMKARGLQFNAVMAGRGKREQSVAELIARYNLADQCKTLGFISEIEPVFKALDVLILPSINEGLGTVMLEAISAEAVVVASNVGGITEVILNDQTGLLAESNNLENFVSQVSAVISDRALSQRLKDGATQHMQENFSLPMMSQQTFDLYQRLLST